MKNVSTKLAMFFASLALAKIKERLKNGETVIFNSEAEFNDFFASVCEEVLSSESK